MRKKNTNRILALLLVLALLLAGCGGEEAENVGGQVSSLDTTEQTQASEAVQGAEETTEATEETTEATEEATEATEATEEKTVSMGVLEGGTYTNTYAGFGCEMDANWTIYPADQLQELPDNMEEMFKGTDLEGVEIEQFTDVMAENLTDLTTFNVLYQKLSMQERLAYALMDEADIIEATLSQYDTLVAAYANAGIIVQSMDKATVTFLGEEHTALYTTATVQDIPYYILQLYDYDSGAYAIVTTFASYVEDNTQSMLDMFYKVG